MPVPKPRVRSASFILGHIISAQGGALRRNATAVKYSTGGISLLPHLR
jgi:hypothetical protein